MHSKTKQTLFDPGEDAEPVKHAWFDPANAQASTGAVPDDCGASEAAELLAGSRPEDELLRTCQGELLDEYLRLADKVGFSCPQVEAARLRRLLVALGMPLYDRSRVKDHLDRKHGGEFVRSAETRTNGLVPSWGWRPLRARDVRSGDIKLGPKSLPSRSGEILATTHFYDKPIPLPVLRTTLHIQEQFPNARFFISDALRNSERHLMDSSPSICEEGIEDPFLAVQLNGGGEVFIVEKWDELGYRHSESSRV